MRPDARPLRRRRRGAIAAAPGRPCAELGHVVDRDDDLDVERLARPGVDDRDRPRSGGRLPAEEPRDLLERPLRRRQADPLRRLVRDGLEPLERERQVRAALGARERVDLVDDDRRGRRAAISRAPRGEHQVERLGRRDQDVGRARGDAPALLGRRVAGAHRRRSAGAASTPRRSAAQADAGERRAQVLLDVDGERPERRDVEDAAALLRRAGAVRASRSSAHRNAASVLPEPVGARISVWSPLGDRGPAAVLGRGGRGEGGVEPGPDRRGEPLEAHGGHGTAPRGHARGRR